MIIIIYKIKNAMKKILFFILLIPLLMGAACTSKSISIEDEQSPVVNQESEEVTTPAENVDDVPKNNVMEETDINYTSYENKAMGYTVLIPEKWYWQHFMKNELTTAGTNELIDDYLIMDKVPLLGLGSEYLGKIVIEKSKLNLAKVEALMNEYNTRELTINGQNAKRFELQTDESNYFPNTKMIEYHLEKNDTTYRLIYHMFNSDEQNEAIFGNTQGCAGERKNYDC